MATRKKKAAKKATPRVPRKVVITNTRQTTIGKPRKTASRMIKQAKDLLYGEMAALYIRKEKATKKMARKKIQKQISEKRAQINRLK